MLEGWPSTFITFFSSNYSTQNHIMQNNCENETDNSNGHNITNTTAASVVCRFPGLSNDVWLSLLMV